MWEADPDHILQTTLDGLGRLNGSPFLAWGVFADLRLQSPCGEHFIDIDSDRYDAGWRGGQIIAINVASWLPGLPSRALSDGRDAFGGRHPEHREQGQNEAQPRFRPRLLGNLRFTGTCRQNPSNHTCLRSGGLDVVPRARFAQNKSEFEVRINRLTRSGCRANRELALLRNPIATLPGSSPTPVQGDKTGQLVCYPTRPLVCLRDY